MSLLDKLAKNSTVKLSSVLSESKFFGEKGVTTTDLPILNLAFSGSLKGGFKSGLTQFAGPSRHFKSNLALFCVKAYMEKHKDAVCLYYDSEFGSPPAYLETFGIDLGRVLHTPVIHVEQLKFDIVAQLDNIERGDKVIIFIDSIGNLASKKETEDALEQKSVADMSRAKAIKSLFRIVTPQLTVKDITCIAINHTIQEMGLYPKTIVTGGCVVAGTKIQMADGTLKNIEDVSVSDSIKTPSGIDSVTHVWTPETLAEGNPECFEIEFEDGYVVTVSDKHKFLTAVGDTYQWVEAKNLTLEMNIVAI
jgi:RecA/RadA recombinase